MAYKKNTFSQWVQSVKKGLSLKRVPAFEYNSPEESKQLISAALWAGTIGWDDVPDSMRDEGTALSYMHLHGDMISDIPVGLRTFQVCMAALKSGSPDNVMRMIPDESKNAEMALLAVSRMGHLLSCFPEHMRTQKVCNLAFKNNPVASLRYIPENFVTSEMCHQAIASDGFTELDSIPDSLLTADMCHEYVQKSSYPTFENMPQRFLTQELVEACIRKNGILIERIPERKRTRKLYEIAIQTYPFILEKMPRKSIDGNLLAIGAYCHGKAKINRLMRNIGLKIEYNAALKRLNKYLEKRNNEQGTSKGDFR